MAALIVSIGGAIAVISTAFLATAITCYRGVRRELRAINITLGRNLGGGGTEDTSAVPSPPSFAERVRRGFSSTPISVFGRKDRRTGETCNRPEDLELATMGGGGVEATSSSSSVL